MKLLKAGPSPFVRKVLVTLIETGQFGEVEMVDVAANPLATDPALIAANPVGKIPALMREDGPALYDSRVICRYLDARKKAGLYPEARLWETLTLEATGDAIMDAAVAIIYEAKFRPQEMQNAPWVEGQWAKVTRGLDALEARWMAHLNGPFDMGHIAIGCALGYLDFRHAGRDWRPGREALAGWYAGFSERGSMQETVPVG